jgi:hypothetical protein
MTLKRDKSDKENKDFWKFVEKTSKEMEKQPDWIKGDFNIEIKINTKEKRATTKTSR